MGKNKKKGGKQASNDPEAIKVSQHTLTQSRQISVSFSSRMCLCDTLFVLIERRQRGIPEGKLRRRYPVVLKGN